MYTMDNTISLALSGSDTIEDTLMKALGDSPLGALFIMPEGKIDMALAPYPEDNPEELDEWTQAADLVAFLMHAISREDWWSEWSVEEEQHRDRVMTALNKLDRERVRQTLRVIPGGLDEQENEDV
jgi:hypothetical protein